uniref:Putative secreted peptide n=1 Tax=Anopheles braziliensis TaxID=58242 RepID=A0A2M3ZQ51_9DIPT
MRSSMLKKHDYATRARWRKVRYGLLLLIVLFKRCAGRIINLREKKAKVTTTHTERERPWQNVTRTHGSVAARTTAGMVVLSFYRS